MNGLFGKLQMSAPQPVAPDVAAAMGDQPTSAYQPLPAPVTTPTAVTPPPTAPVDPNAMSPEQQAASEWLAKQSQPKYSVGDPHLDKYINMFLGN